MKGTVPFHQFSKENTKKCLKLTDVTNLASTSLSGTLTRVKNKLDIKVKISSWEVQLIERGESWIKCH